MAMQDKEIYNYLFRSENYLQGFSEFYLNFTAKIYTSYIDGF